jgi:glyceraldehyde-3-phosphate dehydrogenase (NADP+)
VIIAQSADISSLVATCLAGAFAYAGQICIHAQRFFVHRSHYEKFVGEMKKGAEKLKAGKPEEAETEISSMIDSDNADRVESWVNEALEKGARLITGGKKSGTFYAPTILTQTTPDMKVNAEELFGPVITIEPFDDFGEAVRMLNHSRFGLQAGVFTESISEMNYAFREIEAGGVILNEAPTLRFDHMPYGGIKDSGLGREGVKYAMHDMLEARILVK